MKSRKIIHKGFFLVGFLIVSLLAVRFYLVLKENRVELWNGLYGKNLSVEGRVEKIQKENFYTQLTLVNLSIHSEKIDGKLLITLPISITSHTNETVSVEGYIESLSLYNPLQESTLWGKMESDTLSVVHKEENVFISWISLLQERINTSLDQLYPEKFILKNEVTKRAHR